MIRKILRKRNTKISHVNRLGPEGANFLNQLRSVQPGNLISIQPNGFGFPLFLRNGTSDIPTFYQCIFNAEYNVKIDFTPNVIIDLGANIGLTSAFFLSKYSAAQIIAVEPEISNYELLKKNLSGYKNVKLYNAGIWNKRTNLEIVDSGLGHYGFTVKSVDSPSETSIPAVGVLDIIQENNIQKIDILKIDIEGSEYELFDESAHLWLNKVSLLIIEIHDRMKPGCANKVFNILRDYAFQFEIKGENLLFYFQPKK